MIKKTIRACDVINRMNKEMDDLKRRVHEYKIAYIKIYNRNARAIEEIEHITKQFEEFCDKELISNRVVDIDVLYSILEILKGDEKWKHYFLEDTNQLKEETSKVKFIISGHLFIVMNF